MILLAVAFVVVGFYLYVKWKHYFWKRFEVEQIEPDFFYGNIKNVILGKISIGDEYRKFYEEFKSKGLKYGGVYEFLTPVYVPTDIDIIKCILQKDFNHFRNHGDYINEKIDPLSAHLFALEDEKWKKLRAKLTPTFTSGKMKMMFPTMVDCSEGLEDVLREYAKIQDSVDIKEILIRFTTDIIGSVAFGLDCNSLKDPNTQFLDFSRKIFKGSTWGTIKRAISANLPKSLLSFIPLKKVDKSIEDFFMGVVKSTIDYREKNSIYRKDFMHLLLQLKNRGKVTDDENIFSKGDEKGDHFLSVNEVAAQCYIFFLGGFETSSTTMTFILLELSRNQDIQDKLREEINTVLKKHNDKITYEAIMEMSYLDKVVDEALRLHPPAPVLKRRCNEAYKVPNTDLSIEKGDRVVISILGVHKDPEYYPDPEKFDPDRFNDENKAKRPQFSFMPFGEGPRICIGSRFGLLQTKVGITSILKKFRVTLNEKTQLPITYTPKAIVSAVKGGVWLNLHEVEQM